MYIVAYCFVKFELLLQPIGKFMRLWRTANVYSRPACILDAKPSPI